MNTDSYIFWLNDPKILYKYYLDFFPSIIMSRVEQLNSITRLCIYYSISLIIFEKDEHYFFIPIIVILFVVFIYIIYKKDNKNKINKHKKIEYKTKDLLENFNSKKHKESNHQAHLNDVESNKVEQSLRSVQRQSTLPGANNSISIESGRYDFSNKLQLGNLYSNPNKKEIHSPTYSFDEYKQYVKNTCRKPSIDNPFMNPTALDYGNTNVPQACNSDDEDIKNTIVAKFNENLYRDVDAIWERENSQRQFYTIPNTTVPNQQIEFANWCYNLGSNCKNNQNLCYKYEDLRSNRF